MTIEELKKLKINSFVVKHYGTRYIKYHVSQYVGYSITEETREILPIFKLLPLDKTEPIKYLYEFNAEKYEVIKQCK